MTVLDANIWIAIFNAEDSQHAKAKTTISALKGGVLLPEYILVEVLNVLTTKAGKAKADAFLSHIFAADDVEIGFSTKDFLYRVIQTFLGNEYKKLSFVDQSLLYLSQFHKVITFDKNLAKHL